MIVTPWILLSLPPFRVRFASSSYCLSTIAKMRSFSFLLATASSSSPASRFKLANSFRNRSNLETLSSPVPSS